MELNGYVDELQRQLSIAADAGGAEARDLAERLAAPLDAAARLMLLEALSAAAGEITAELAPGSVDVRLRGRDPEFVVNVATPPDTTDVLDADRSTPDSGPSPLSAEFDEGGTSRTTLRLPDELKARVEAAAGREHVSVNTWLVRAVAAALDPSRSRRVSRSERGGHVTGWVR